MFYMDDLKLKLYVWFMQIHVTCFVKVVQQLHSSAFVRTPYCLTNIGWDYTHFQIIDS